LTVSVSDSRIGIRSEDIEKLFNPFGQIDMSSTKQYEGTGLGLYLCKKILALLRGTISVKSEYGRGSTFTFILPIKRKENPHEENSHH
jgi:two-component system, NtrC family, sensor kinase